ncbi:MAG: Xaa-Pro dipeptidyl-peptidase [Planctomycetes bacterium]|nr:Xaa-Pro dipeptidyl-peptidase [Planctomycetota bacterium]MCB9872162.1 Xaa-Pro dipeptidyl-peptidase [Planctomycetota bacterium]
MASPPIRPFLLALTSTLSQLAAQDGTATKAAPVFRDGQAQVVEAFADASEWIRHELWVETEFDCDGNHKRDRVHVDVTRQKQTDSEGLKVPVIYESSPYYAGTASMGTRSYFWNPRHKLGQKPPQRGAPDPIPFRAGRDGISRSLVRTWVPRGFAVVHSSAPGTGQSQGCVTVGGEIERLAPKAVIDWLNGRAKGFTSPDGSDEVKATWCTGKVGMTGTSYNGTIPVAAATTGVAGLEVIIPVAPNTSYYHYYRSNGLVRHPGGWMGEDVDVLYDFVNSGALDRRAACDTKYRDAVIRAGMDRLTGDYNEFWKSRDLWPLLGNIRCAALLAHAWNDWNVMPRHTVEVYRAMQKKGLPAAVFFHQGGHGGNPPLEMMNRWFTRFLYGVENGVEKAPHAFIVREGAREPTAYPDYPHPQAAAVVLHPGKGGNSAGALRTTKAASQGRESLTDDVGIDGAALARAARSNHRLIYASKALTEPLHLSGTCRVSLRMSCNASAANLSVWLVALPWDQPARGEGRQRGRGRRRPITDDIITRGWADPQNQASASKSAPLQPGKMFDLAFDLEPDDQVIPAGQQIALMIFASDRDFTLWPPAGTELTIDLDHTSLTIPVVGGAEAWRKATGETGSGSDK